MSADPLQDACQAGDLSAVERLLAEGKSSNNFEGSSPLAWAVEIGHRAIAEKLIAAGAEVNEFYEDGTTLLTSAIERGRLTLVKLLVESGAELVSPGSEEHALLFAARAKQRKIFEYLAPLADPAVRDEGESLLEIVSSRKPTQRQQLVEAAASGDLERIRLYIAAGVDVNGFNEFRRTPLMAAALMGQVEAVDMLLDGGADPRRTSSKQFGPLHCGAEFPEIVRRLLDAGADPDESFPMIDEPDWTPMCACVVRDSPDSLRLVRERSSRNVGVDDWEFAEWVYLAARHGAPRVMQALRDEGWDLNCTAAACDPALIHVLNWPLPGAEERHVALIRWLLDAGADPHACRKHQGTPAIQLAFEGTWDKYPEVVEMLLDAGADINAVDERGQSMLHIAAPGAWMAIVKNLPWRNESVARMKRVVEVGGDPELRNAEGQTVAENIDAMEAALTRPPEVKQAWKELSGIQELWRLLGR